MIQRLVAKPPPGDEWLHEIKYDGYRMQIVSRDDRIRLFTRRGGELKEVPAKKHRDL